ncbi:MAG: PepSY-associated TM helix domain-containing protein [Saprospiraceae bacterium]
MKVFFRTIHLYLSLAAGLVILVVCFTGAVLVFEKEMQMALYPERYFVEPSAKQASLAQMEQNLQQTVPGATLNSAKIYNNPKRTIELNYAVEKPGEAKPGAGGSGKGGGNNGQAFMHPYTGELISLYSYRKTFFYTMFALHRWLLADDIGKLIVGISTLLFLVILLTGIILWLPKNVKILKQRLTLKLNAGWKRINHDLHIVIGFYTAIFLFAFAFTGLAWSFKWFNDGIYKITGTENKRAEPLLSQPGNDTTAITLDAAYHIAKQTRPDAKYYQLNVAKGDSAAIAVTVLSKNAVHERATDQLFIDQYSGAVLGQQLYRDRNLGQRVRSTFYPIHVGSIAGLPGRIIAFLACLAGVTFPITGVIMWINRLQKKKQQKQRKSVKRKTIVSDLQSNL